MRTFGETLMGSFRVMGLATRWYSSWFGKKKYLRIVALTMYVKTSGSI